MITMLTRSAVLQALVEKERLKTKELVEEEKREAQREAGEREREMEERTAKLLEEHWLPIWSLCRLPVDGKD